MPHSRQPPLARPRRGFTLIEVLVALVILSVMALMAWQGVDGIVRAREIADGAMQRTLRLQSVMAQWQADLNAVIDTQAISAVQFDGGAMRLTRRAQGSGVQVVVWSLRSGRWVRWAGPPVTTVGQLQEQWSRSFAFQGREPGTLAALKGVQQWQVYFFRGGAWTNAQSSAGVSTRQPSSSSESGALAQALAGREPLPLGVRCVLTLGEGSGYEGVITRDVQMAAQPNQN